MAVTTKISKNYQLTIFGILLVAWLSGVTFFILNNFVTVAGEFGPEKHPWQFSVLQIHGVAAFFMIMMFGYLLASHIRLAWKVRPLQKMGLVMAGLHLFLIITAYLLYYVGDGSRVLIGYAHASAGFVYPIILVFHINLKRSKKKKMKLSILNRNTLLGIFDMCDPSSDYHCNWNVSFI